MVSSDEISRKLNARRRGEKLSPQQQVENSSTVNCPDCGTTNQAQAKFCVGCGKPMAQEPITAPTSQDVASKQPISDTSQIETENSTKTPPTASESPVDYKVCPSCSQKNKLNAKFCIICGHKFEDDENTTTPSETPSTSGSDFPSAKNVLESENESTPEPISESPDTATVEEETPVIPEIKVPDHLKSENADNKSQIQEEVTQTTENSVPETSESLESAESLESEQPVISAEEQDIGTDPVEKIKKAKELLDIGAITQEEFDEIKNKYLKQI